METKNTTHDDALVAVTSTADLAQEINGSNEWVRFRELAGAGSFNIIHATTRDAEYKREQFKELVLEIQFLDGDMRGATANTSTRLCDLDGTNEDNRRQRILDTYKKRGAIGPFWLKHIPEDDTRNEYYMLVTANPANDPTQAKLPLEESGKGDAPTPAAKRARRSSAK